LYTCFANSFHASAIIIVAFLMALHRSLTIILLFSVSLTSLLNIFLLWYTLKHHSFWASLKMKVESSSETSVTIHQLTPLWEP
jgi:archaellum biogenesis protein FlaJ (TadC family)